MDKLDLATLLLVAALVVVALLFPLSHVRRPLPEETEEARKQERQAGHKRP